ncbi:DUF1918 domain-containing protein [Streptomyces solincola]|uniref:DUF1918 domain-containing protein n=2 Tax=Streptomyces solincola TaxID=2100817 RepID=A0A2S9Q245_9ACTN|nr:DUF1918 domain-containing protein [Streptomyces solincola]
MPATGSAWEPPDSSADDTGQSPPATRPEATGGSVCAHLDDEIVVGGSTAGTVVRDAEIVGLHHPDGTPPYDVRRADDGRITLYFPGPDVFVRHLSPTPRNPSSVR